LEDIFRTAETYFSGILSLESQNITIPGIPVLFFLTMVGSLGIPFPVTFVVIAAGVLVKEGIFNGFWTIIACLAGATIADHIEYLIGRFGLTKFERRFLKKPVWIRASATFQRFGGWAVCLTRFWLTPLAPAINLIAGRKISYLRFLLFDLFGQIIWVLIFGGLGYIFNRQWIQITQISGDFTKLSMMAVILFSLLLLFMKRFRKVSR